MKFPSLARLRAGAALVLLAASFAPAAQAQPEVPRAATRFAQATPITDRYIIRFDDSVAEPLAQAMAMARGAGAQMHHAYSHVFKGFAATLPAAAVEALRHNPLIASIEQDARVSLAATAANATWGLDRIDQADRPLDTLYSYNGNGAGVTAFVLDTGLRADHVEFTGRVGAGYTSFNDGRGTNDCHGHGTHVAGTIGGTTYGVAKGVKIVPVRVLDCSGSGSWSGIIAGLDWAVASGMRPAVANMSIGGSASSSLNAAVANAVAKGVTVVVAAGNSNTDACTTSPASEPSAITVGATNKSDARASFSNFGRCVDLFAPGENITSASHSSTSGVAYMSGTSMATPHVAGVAALTLAANPSATPAAVANHLVTVATVNRLTSVGTGSPNLLLYSLGTGQPTAPAASAIAVKSLAASTTRSWSGWRAKVTITVRNVATGAAVANVKATGSFSPGGSVSCVTGSTGACTVTSTNLSVASTTFSVGTLSGTNMSYDASQNAASQLVVNRR
jgi:subtilisin family serine protease